MLVRPKQIDTKIRWRRRGRGGHDASRSGEGSVEGRDRRGEPSEDKALYTCQCGYVFQALVSTSVGCPHCGDTQAW